MNIGAIRRELRHGRSPSLRNRRRIGLLAAVGLVDFAVISLYQIGVIRRLPDLPGRVFDSNQVNASRKAYQLGVPDGTTGAALYAGILILAAAGGSRGSGRVALLDLLLGAAVASGVAGAGIYLRDMIVEQAKACPYCLLGAGINLAMVPAAWPGVREGVRSLRRRGWKRGLLR